MALARARTVSIIGGLLVAVLGCTADEDGSNEQLGQDFTPAPGDSAVMSTSEPAQLDDGAIAAILAASDTSEIAPSELARDQGNASQVQQYAEMMIRDHGMLSDSLSALTRAQGITPMPGRESETLKAQTRATLQGLQALTGAAFDSAYVAAMVQSHEAALNSIDGQLLPGATNPELRAAIEQKVRPAVAGHLEQARQIQTTLSGP